MTKVGEGNQCHGACMLVLDRWVLSSMYSSLFNSHNSLERMLFPFSQSGQLSGAGESLPAPGSAGVPTPCTFCQAANCGWQTFSFRDRQYICFWLCESKGLWQPLNFCHRSPKQPQVRRNSAAMCQLNCMNGH